MTVQETLLKYTLQSRQIVVSQLAPSSFTLLVTAKGTAPTKPKPASRAERLKARLAAERGEAPAQSSADGGGVVNIASIKVTLKVGKNERDFLSMEAPKSVPHPSGYDSAGDYHSELKGWSMTPSTRRSDPIGTFLATAQTPSAQTFNALSALAMTWQDVHVNTGFGEALITIEETDTQGTARTTQLSLTKVEAFQFPKIKVTRIPGEDEGDNARSSDGHLVLKDDRVRLSWEGTPGVPYYLIWAGAPLPIPVNATDHYDTPPLKDTAYFLLEAEAGAELKSDSLVVSVYDPTPRIAYFYTDQAWAKPGDPVTLHWGTENIDSVVLEASPTPKTAFNSAPKGGFQTVYPTTSTTYTLTVPGTGLRATIGIRVPEEINLGRPVYVNTITAPPMGCSGYGVCIAARDGLVRVDGKKVTFAEIWPDDGPDAPRENRRSILYVDQVGTAVVSNEHRSDGAGRKHISVRNVAHSGEMSFSEYENQIPLAVGKDGDPILAVGSPNQNHALARSTSVMDSSASAHVEWLAGFAGEVVVSESGTVYGSDDNGIFDWPRDEGPNVHHWGKIVDPNAPYPTVRTVVPQPRQMVTAPDAPTHWPLYTFERFGETDVVTLCDRRSDAVRAVNATTKGGILKFGVLDEDIIAILTNFGTIRLWQVIRDAADPLSMPKVEFASTSEIKSSNILGKNIADMAVTGGEIYLTHSDRPNVITYIGPVFAPPQFGDVPGSEIIEFTLETPVCSDVGTPVHIFWKLKNANEVYFCTQLQDPDRGAITLNPETTIKVDLAVTSPDSSKKGSAWEAFTVFRRKKARIVAENSKLTWAEFGGTIRAIASVPLTSKHLPGYAVMLIEGEDQQASRLTVLEPGFVATSETIDLGRKVKDKVISGNFQGKHVVFGKGRAALHFDAKGTAYIFNPDGQVVYLIDAGSKWIRREIKLPPFSECMVSPDGRIAVIGWEPTLAGSAILCPILIEISGVDGSRIASRRLSISENGTFRIVMEASGIFDATTNTVFSEKSLVDPHIMKIAKMSDRADSYTLALGQGTPTRNFSPEDGRLFMARSRGSAVWDELDSVFELNQIGNKVAMTALKDRWLVISKGKGQQDGPICSDRPITDFCVGVDNRIWVVTEDGWVGRTE